MNILKNNLPVRVTGFLFFAFDKFFLAIST